MYSFESRIRYSETDVSEQLKLESLIDYFQDCSSFQSEDGGVGFDFLREHHAAWIVNYWQIDLARRPHFGERVVIGTSPYGFKGFIGLRNFWMETEGERLATANSVWSLFDLEKGVPVKVLPEMAAAYALAPKFDMEYLPRKIKIPEATDLSGSFGDTEPGGTPKGGGKPEKPAVEAGYYTKLLHEEIPVTKAMLDSNGHMNNGQYVRLAMAFVPDVSKIHRLRVEYVGQAHAGDVIVPETYVVQEKELIVLRGSADGKPYAVVEIS